MAAPIPRIMYGTAWKAARTKDLVLMGVLNGFRGIDTATQPKHYNQIGVGEALKELEVQHNIPRSSLFVQTKFTSLDGHDLNKPLPYDKNAPLSEQVRQSFATALQELQTNYVDSLIMHSPMRSLQDTLIVWDVFETLVLEKKTRFIGISNLYDARVFKHLISQAKLKPTFIQNRFYAQTGYDQEIRQICKKEGIRYQSFWTLTANPHLLKSKVIMDVSANRSITPAQALYKYLMDIDVIPLSGTTSEQHAKEDVSIAATQESLLPEEIHNITEALRS